MSKHSTVRPPNSASGNRRRRASALTRRVGVLAAAAAMVATVFVVASPAGAAVTQSSSADVQAVAAVSPVAGWSDTGAMITPRANHVATRLADGRVLIAGGNGSAGVLSSSEIYSPATGTWKAAANMPVAVADAAAVTLANGIVLVAGGSSNVTELYNATANTWTVGPQMPAIGGGATFAATLPNGHVFFLGSTSAADYNPISQAWLALATPPTMRGGTITTLDTTVLPNGDVLTLRAMLYDCCMPGSPTTGPAVYHWATNTWSVLPVPPVNPGDVGVSVAALPNGNVMLAAGVMNYLWFPAAVNTVLEVNPTTGAWTIDQDLPRPYGAVVALPNGSILAVNGFPDYIYSPTARTWTEVPGNNHNSDSATFTALTDGTVLASGGYSDRYYAQPYWVFQTQAAIFTPTAGTTPTPATHHIGDLDNATASLSSLSAASSLKAVSSRTWRPRVAATVLDAAGAPVSGATVSGTFSHHSGTLTCVTVANGTCTVGNFSLSRSTTSTVFTVTGVVKASSTYTPKANSDPDGDSNGTTITVKRP